MNETDLVKGILDYLYIRHIFAWRNNTGAFKAGERFIRFGKKGSSDIIGIYRGKFLAIECKWDKGRATPEQLQFLKDIKANGGIAILARSLDDVIKAL